MKNMNPGYALHGFGTEIDQFDKPIETNFQQGTLGFNIDDFVNIFSPPMPTHIKINIDGIEADILEGGRNTISSTTARSIIVEIEWEISQERKMELHSLLAGLGFIPPPQASAEFRNVIFRQRGVMYRDSPPAAPTSVNAQFLPDVIDIKLAKFFDPYCPPDAGACV